jgi:hypothetical protein
VLVLIDMGEFDGYTRRGAHVYRERSALESLLIAPDGSLALGAPRRARGIRIDQPVETHVDTVVAWGR